MAGLRIRGQDARIRCVAVVRHRDAHAVGHELQPEQSRGSAVPDGVRGQLGGDQDRVIHDVVGDVPLPEFAGHVFAGSAGSGQVVRQHPLDDHGAVLPPPTGLKPR